MPAFPQIAFPTGRCIDVILHLLAARPVCDRMHCVPADLPPSLRVFNCARVKKNRHSCLVVSVHVLQASASSRIRPSPLPAQTTLFVPEPPTWAISDGSHLALMRLCQVHPLAHCLRTLGFPAPVSRYFLRLLLLLVQGNEAQAAVTLASPPSLALARSPSELGQSLHQRAGSSAVATKPSRTPQANTSRRLSHRLMVAEKTSPGKPAILGDPSSAGASFLIGRRNRPAPLTSICRR